MTNLSLNHISERASELVSECQLYCALLHERLYYRMHPEYFQRLSQSLRKRIDAGNDTTIPSLRHGTLDSEVATENAAVQTEPVCPKKTDNSKEPESDTPSQSKRAPMLYQDLGWDLETNFYYTIRPGDFSPLSPDADVLERSGKIGLDFWKWNRDRNPLGYTPPLCTCKRMAEPKALLRKYATGITAPKELRVCENDVCRGLLYIPYSMIEVPLNRTISNGSEFAKQVAVPDDTDVYCGSMKHTLVLCTTSRKHEEECLEAIRKSNVPHTLVYDVRAPDFLPYFKKRLDTITIAPLMAVEPIDSDVSDNEDNYGFGECFAVKHTERGLVIHKYDPSTQELSEIDPAMLKCWAGGDGELLPQEPVTQLGDYTLCELIESFSGERRPLKLSLRRTVTFNRRKELIHDDIDTSPIRIKRKLSSSGSCEIPEVVLENAHMHSVINAIDNITQ